MTVSGSTQPPGISDEAIDGLAAMECERHQQDVIRGGCVCGFCAWSVEHVAIMAARVAARVAHGGPLDA